MPDGPLASPFFILFIAHRTSPASVLRTTLTTLLAAMSFLHLFSAFINLLICSFQISFRSFTPAFTMSLLSLARYTRNNIMLSPALCVIILSNSLLSRQESIFFTASHAAQSITTETIRFVSFFISSSFPLSL